MRVQTVCRVRIARIADVAIWLLAGMYIRYLSKRGSGVGVTDDPLLYEVDLKNGWSIQLTVLWLAPVA